MALTFADALPAIQTVHLILYSAAPSPSPFPSHNTLLWLIVPLHASAFLRCILFRFFPGSSQSHLYAGSSMALGVGKGNLMDVAHSSGVPDTVRISLVLSFPSLTDYYPLYAPIGERGRESCLVRCCRLDRWASRFGSPSTDISERSPSLGHRCCTYSLPSQSSPSLPLLLPISLAQPLALVHARRTVQYPG